ncbi:hypothetical protein [Ornithinimicrobium kibberense]|uniref:hypothetical protein n=1 Tax=Ornithinimicrobium kibberense TaxID=282060 RepID=UPI00360F8137
MSGRARSAAARAGVPTVITRPLSRRAGRAVARGRPSPPPDRDDAGPARLVSAPAPPPTPTDGGMARQLSCSSPARRPDARRPPARRT